MLHDKHPRNREVIRLDDLNLGASLFYPASNLDETPVRHCSDRFRSFVYADCSVGMAELKKRLKLSGGFGGFAVSDLREVQPERLFGASWAALAEGNADTIRALPSTQDKPYALRATLAKGSERSGVVNLLFIRFEGVAIYRELFGRRGIAPACLAHICPGLGMGGNFSGYAKKLEEAVKASDGGLPHFLLSDHLCRLGMAEYMGIVDQYRKIKSWKDVQVANGPLELAELQTENRKSHGSSEARVQIVGGTGKSVQDAVVVNAPDESVGVHAEYEYVAQVCGEEGVDWKREKQEYFSRDGGKHYDRLTVRLRNGEFRRFYFDITGFFGGH